MRVAIVGAGISGLSCASFLRDDTQVVVFDEGRAPGGRTTTKKVGVARFDVAAPWFEASSEGFRAVCAKLSGRKTIARFEPVWAPGSEAIEDELWVGVPGMNAIARELAGEVELRWGTAVTRVLREAEGFRLFGRSEELGVFERVVVAVSAADARAFVRESKLDDSAFANVKTASQWSVACEFPAEVNCGFNAGRWRDGKLRLAVRETSKPEREGGELWTAYASTEWSEAHATMKATDVATEIAEVLKEKLSTGLNPSARAFNWSDASVVTPAGKPTVEIDGVLFCGDWCVGGGVEAAWKSGVLTAQRVVRGD